MEQNFIEVLTQALGYHGDYEGVNVAVRTFEEYGLLTANQGIVVKYDGEEYVVTVQKR